MKNALLLFVGFALALPCLASAQEPLKVIKINKGHTRVITTGATLAGWKVGDSLATTNEFNEDCVGRVEKVNPKDIVLDVGACANSGIVQMGSVFRKTEAPLAVASATPSPAPAAWMEAPAEDEGPRLPSKNESWYTMWGLGFSRVNYQSDTQKIIDYNEAIPGVSRSVINMDLFGFYWPWEGHKAMSGFIWNTISDTLSNDKTSERVSITQHMLGFSHHHFFGQNIGHGWYARGDIGASWLNVNSVGSNNLTITDKTYDSGLGFLAGGGYAMPVSDGTRVLFGANLTNRRLDDERATTANFSVNFLW